MHFLEFSNSSNVDAGMFWKISIAASAVDAKLSIVFFELIFSNH